MAESFVLNGNVTLEVFTQSINKAQSSGKLCIYLFKRHEVGSPPVATDTMLTNSLGGTPYWTYFESPIWTTELKPKLSDDDLQRSALYDPGRRPARRRLQRRAAVDPG